MDSEKLKKMQSALRTGGRGTARRKRPVHKGGQIDEKRLQNIFKKNSAVSVAGASEVKIYFGEIILHIVRATVKHSQSANYYVVSGCTHAETAMVNCPQPVAGKQGGQAPVGSSSAQASTLRCHGKK